MNGDDQNNALGTPQPDDATVLAHFASKKAFIELCRTWSSGEASAFCRIARAVHAAGFDWWHTDIQATQVRFGRKEIGAARAAGVLGYVLRKRPTIIEMNRIVEGVSDAHNGRLSVELADQIERLMIEERAALQTWMPAEHPRDGLWPDEIAAEGAVSAPAQDVPRFWIEKTIVTGRSDREQGDHALGRALWSPQRSKSGGDIYASMRAVRPGDVVFHLTDNQAITGVSIAAEAVDDSFQGLAGTDWEGPGYRIALRDHELLTPPLERASFLATEPFATELSELAKSGAKGLFYNAHRGLNQGAYLTEATPTLLSILSRAYQAFAGQPLPYIEDEIAVSSAPPATRDAYTLDDALQDLFLERAEAEQVLLLWRAKRNIILQGPPGVGKSFAAQRLAFALIGAADRERLGFVQFHQSYSYEDFVEGYRPTADGFELRPGKFVEFCRRAEADPEHSYVFVID
jgi:hypothetical protein